MNKLLAWWRYRSDIPTTRLELTQWLWAILHELPKPWRWRKVYGPNYYQYRILLWLERRNPHEQAKQQEIAEAKCEAEYGPRTAANEADWRRYMKYLIYRG